MQTIVASELRTVGRQHSSAGRAIAVAALLLIGLMIYVFLGVVFLGLSI